MLYNNYALFGKSGSGKTQFIKQKFIPLFKPENVMAIDFKGSLGLKPSQLCHVPEILCMKAKTSKNSLFIVDDATGILKAGNSNVVNDFLFLLNTARHDNNYFIFVYHSTLNYPETFTSGIHCFIFFPFQDTRELIQKRLPIMEDHELKAITMKKEPFVYPDFTGREFVAVYKNK